MFFYWECSQRRFLAVSRKLSALFSVPPRQNLFSLNRVIKSRFCKFTYPCFLSWRSDKDLGASRVQQQHTQAEQKIQSALDSRGKGCLDVLCCLERDLHREWNSCCFLLSEHFHSVWWRLCLPIFLWCWLEFNCLFSVWFPTETCRTMAPDGFPPILPSLANNV